MCELIEQARRISCGRASLFGLGACRPSLVQAPTCQSPPLLERVSSDKSENKLLLRHCEVFRLVSYLLLTDQRVLQKDRC